MKPFFRTAQIAATALSLTALTGVAFAQAPSIQAPKPAPLPPPVKLPAGVAARVNGKDLTYAELSAKLQAWGGRPMVQQLVQTVVIEQEAKKQGVTVTPAEITAEIAKVKQQQVEQQASRGGILTWAQIAARDGISDGYVLDNVRLGLLARKTYAKTIEKNIPSLDGQIKVSHILIPTIDLEPKPDAKPKTPEEEKQRDADAKKQAEDILADIKSGKITFEDAAKKYSADKGTAVQGGALPYTPKGRFDPAFEAAAWGLDKPNDITPVPVKSSFGYHIIKLISKGANAPQSEKAAYRKEQLDQQLQNPQGIGMWVQYLMSSAKVQYSSPTATTPAPAKPAAKKTAKSSR